MWSLSGRLMTCAIPLPGPPLIVLNGARESVFDYVQGAGHQCVRVAPQIAAEPQFACGVERADQGADRKPSVESCWCGVAESLGDDLGEPPGPFRGQGGEVARERGLVG